MYFVDNNSGVTDMPPLAPSQGTQVKWFTEGDGRKGISHIGQDWLNIVQAELLAILTEGKVQPDKAKLNQLVTAIKAIIAANAYSRKNNLKEIADAGAEAQAAARRHLGLGGLSGKDSLAAADVGALEKSRNFDDVPDKPTARLNLDVYSKGEGDERYLRRDQNGADIPDKGTFIDNLGLRETVNKAADALPSGGTAVAANRLATPRNINGVP
ncbi:phage tail protein, partial [Escherichia coli]|nr:phage tail protein [Escherichia coli]EFQ3862430.1 phage tail protein [Escherichia coli]